MLKMGGFYVTHGGDVVQIVEVSLLGFFPFTGSNGEHYTSDGTTSLFGSSLRDISHELFDRNEVTKNVTIFGGKLIEFLTNLIRKSGK